MTRVETGPGWELRCGRYQDVLFDVECDATVTDPPYSERTENGVRSGSTMKDGRERVGMGYDPVDRAWCYRFAAEAHRRSNGWVVICGDHVTWRWYDIASTRLGRYSCHPISIVKHGAAPRMCADGPASWLEWIHASRPRKAEHVGTWAGIRGWYHMQTVRHGHGHIGVRGSKSVDTMRQIIRDYTRPGDLVCDPCAGGGTTLLAAVMEGRRAIGAEMDPKTFELAVKRLRGGYTQDMFGGHG